ncbi:hypothetical protein ABE54_11995 [Bacillus thuringiensis]|nr:hypothetical protein [Bacillus thuringiensis]
MGTGLMKFIPGLGVVAGPYGALLNYVYGGVIDELFPKKDAGGQDTVDPTVLFQTFMAAAEQMIDEKLNDTVKSTAVTKLAGLKNNLTDLKTKLDTLKDNSDPKDTDELKKQVRDKFEAVHGLFRSDMPQFRVASYESILLPVYAQAANLHLIFLREAIIKGVSEWGFPQATIDKFYDNPTDKNGFKQLMEEYTTNCMSAYQQGLDKLATQSIDLCTSDQSYWNPAYYNQYLFLDDLFSYATCQHSLGDMSYGCGGGELKPICKNYNSRIYSKYMQSITNWNQYNDYVMSMQVTALDLVAMWPYWDPKVYPNGAKKELTREIYTDILGSPDGQTKGVTTISQELLPQPRLFTQLTQLDLNTEPHTIQQVTRNPVSGKVNATYKYLDGDIIVGITQHLQTTLGESKLHAQGSGGSKTQSYDNSYTNDFTMPLKVASWFEPRTIGFAKSSGEIYPVGTIGDETPFVEISKSIGHNSGTITAIAHHAVKISESTQSGYYEEYQGDTAYSIDEHRLSWMNYTPTSASSFVVTGKQIGSLSLGWTSSTVDPTNKVQKDTITSIPAVKSHSITDWGTGTVVKGPGHTGGDLVKLPSNTRAKMIVTIEDTSTSYDVRIRYAAPSGGHIQFSYWNGGSDVKVADTQLQNTGGNTNFEHFQYAMLTTDNAKFKAPFSPVEILIENIGDSDVYLDKVEFLVLSQPLSEQLPPGATPLTSQYMNPYGYNILWQSKNGEAANQGMVTFSQNDSAIKTFYLYNTEVVHQTTGSPSSWNGKFDTLYVQSPTSINLTQGFIVIDTTKNNPEPPIALPNQDILRPFTNEHEIWNGRYSTKALNLSLSTSSGAEGKIKFYNNTNLVHESPALSGSPSEPYTWEGSFNRITVYQSNSSDSNYFNLFGGFLKLDPNSNDNGNNGGPHNDCENIAHPDQPLYYESNNLIWTAAPNKLAYSTTEMQFVLSGGLGFTPGAIGAKIKLNFWKNDSIQYVAYGAVANLDFISAPAQSIPGGFDKITMDNDEYSFPTSLRMTLGSVCY